jgi:hypothetical protein
MLLLINRSLVYFNPRSRSGDLRQSGRSNQKTETRYCPAQAISTQPVPGDARQTVESKVAPQVSAFPSYFLFGCPGFSYDGWFTSDL